MWSPVSTTRSISQSTNATAPTRTGLPDGAGRHFDAGELVGLTHCKARREIGLVVPEHAHAERARAGDRRPALRGVRHEKADQGRVERDRHERAHRETLRAAVDHAGHDRDARRHVCHHLTETLRAKLKHRRGTVS